jgi:hypothetical protein
MSIKTWAGMLTMAMVSAGCAPQWQNIRKETRFEGPARAYVATLPGDWKRAPTDSDILLITRDGLYLQQISVTHYKLDEAFVGVKLKPDAVPSDLAALQLRAFREKEQDLARYQDEETKGVLALFPVEHGKPLPGTVERVTIRPYTVDGVDAFDLETRSFNSWGLEYVSQSIGFIHENEYWLVRYLAPKLHYAQWDQATFNQFLGNLKLKPKCRIFCRD